MENKDNNQIKPQDKQPILQPSKEFVEEMKTSTATSPPNIPANANNQAANPDPSTIYPEATTGIKLTDNPNGKDPLKSNYENKKSFVSTLIIIIITLFGSYLVFSGLLGLIGSIKLLSFGVFRTSGTLIGVIDVVYILIGLGLILRKEIARLIYIVVAVIGLCLTIYGTVRYVRAIDNITKTQHQYIIATNNQIAGYKNNSSISESDRDQIIQQLKNDENTQVLLISKEKKDSIAPIIEGYAIAIIPIVLLTRRIVKKEFF